LLCARIHSRRDCGSEEVRRAKASGPAPDKALLQKLLDGWNSMDPANVAQYYAQGIHAYFDIAPLKYSSWDEYANGVKNCWLITRPSN